MTQPASIQLSNPAAIITVGTKQIANIGQQIGIDCWFSVRRSLRPKEPNTCDLRLQGLSDSTRQALAGSSAGTVAQISSKPSKPPIVPVKIEAGYAGGTSVIFLGQMRSAQTVTDGPDNVTELTTGDGDEAALLARSTASFGTGATPYTVALQLLDDMGIGLGNTATVQSILTSSPLFQAGYILKGSSLDHMVDLAASCALEFTIQHGVAQWTKLGQALGGNAYLLSSTDTNTGLIGSPSVDTKGVLTLKTLMIPGLAPGKSIQVKAKYVQGFYRIVSMQTTGDTSGEEWGHDLECKALGLGIG